MKNQFVPFDKLSKRAQRELNARKRKGWGGINPVTRKPPNPKAYDRKKNSEACDKASFQPADKAVSVNADTAKYLSNQETCNLKVQNQ